MIYRLSEAQTLSIFGAGAEGTTPLTSILSEPTAIGSERAECPSLPRGDRLLSEGAEFREGAAVGGVAGQTEGQAGVKADPPGEEKRHTGRVRSEAQPAPSMFRNTSL